MTIEVLDVVIGELCEKLSELNKRERDVNKNARTDVDLVERKPIEKNSC